jgi:hypothetical protein
MPSLRVLDQKPFIEQARRIVLLTSRSGGELTPYPAAAAR